MNYRHIFHAGNRADVVKHAVLTLLLKALQQKPAPLAVLDTHAGIGLYDLTSEAARKTGEATDGIVKFLASDRIPELADYYDAIALANPSVVKHSIHYYPGSPSIVARMLRPDDRLMACELHPEDAATLRHLFYGKSAIHVHERDGYEALRALLPPKEKRGLVLIDPPFEDRDEFARMAASLVEAHARWAGGVYALWYPIKERPTVWRFHDQLAASGIRKQLVAEFVWQPEDRSDRFNGAGLIIVNPPWQLDEQLQALWPKLQTALGLSHQSGKIAWLVPE